MRTTLLLLLLAPMAWGQMSYMSHHANDGCKETWEKSGQDSTRWFINSDKPDEIVSGSPVGAGVEQGRVAAILLRLYSEYADSCWADSTAPTSTMWQCADPNCTTCNKGYWHSRPNYVHWHLPTFEGFIEFLRRKYK